MPLLERSAYVEQAALELEIAGWFDKVKGVPEKAKEGLKHELKHQVTHIADNFGTSKSAVILAWQEPKPMNILKACGYSLATMYGAFHMAHKVAEEGALHVIAHLAEHNVGHKAGHAAGHKLQKTQELIKKYPVLRKLTGPALAGMMLYGYTLTEPHALGDWNMANVKKAFDGSFGVADFMATPEAVSLGVHVASGKVLSLRALAENVGTLCLGLCATAVMNSDHPKLKKLVGNVNTALAALTAKRSPLHDIEASKNFTGTKETMGIDVADVGPSSQSKDGVTKKQKDVDKKKKAGGGDWWDSMSKAAKKDYLQKHPQSVFKGKS